MPINITWSARIYAVQAAQPYMDHDHVYQLELRDGDGNLIPNALGNFLYIIQNQDGVPVYAGQADRLRNRFDARGRVLREFGLNPAEVLAGYTVRTATVAPGAQLNAAERWLVRILYLADQDAEEQTLTNVALTQAFEATEDLTINNLGTVPGYLEDQYEYDEGAEI